MNLDKIDKMINSLEEIIDKKKDSKQDVVRLINKPLSIRDIFIKLIKIFK